MKLATITQPEILARNSSLALPHKAYCDPLIEIVVPVLNEEKILAQSIVKIYKFMSKNLPYRFKITIADNGSSDKTPKIGQILSQKFENIEYFRLEKRGRGRALKTIWMNSKAEILSYMDVDLSTSLNDFLPMIQSLIDGEAGVAIGSRLASGSKTTRGFKREFISRSYNFIIRRFSKTKFSDAQCGFKAIRRDIAREFLPQISDNEWFFDTELLIKTEKRGVKIHEQPVHWIEDTDSRVKIIKTATEDLKGLSRVNRELGGKTIFEVLFLPMILLGAGAIYLFGGLQNGMANSYYAAAVQAASQDWAAWLFGSLDSSNFISVDKPPLATMIMGLSARILGFSNFSMILPNVLAAVGSIWLVYSIVRKYFGFKSAMIASLIMTFTPILAVMAGFNNPDVILTFFLTASGYAFLRSLENKKPLFWLSLAGVMTGMAFNTKMLQGLLLVPIFGVVYLFFSKPKMGVRILHLIWAGIWTAISTFWWAILVWITPAENRPWVGSTNDNSIWSLIFGYNGFGRFFGSGGGMGGGNSGGMGARMTGFGGATGFLRMFNNEFGPNIAWFLPLAILSGVALLWIFRKMNRASIQRNSVIFWLVWILIHMAVFSFTAGVIHPYYVVAMSPAVAALVGIGLPILLEAYRRRNKFDILLPIAVLLTVVMAVVNLSYNNNFPVLSWGVMIVGLVGGLMLWMNLFEQKKYFRNWGLIASTVSIMAAPIIWTISSVSVAHTGSIPTSGPSSTAMRGSNNENSQSESALTEFLLNNSAGTKWIAAVNSANESAAIQLSTKSAVMALGGFNGSDNPLTLDDFKQLVASGQVKYYISSGNGRGGGPRGGNSEIISWIQQNGKTVDYGGDNVVVYQLLA